jgi:hypothetical protein
MKNKDCVYIGQTKTHSFEYGQSGVLNDETMVFHPHGDYEPAKVKKNELYFSPFPSIIKFSK